MRPALARVPGMLRPRRGRRPLGGERPARPRRRGHARARARRPAPAPVRARIAARSPAAAALDPGRAADAARGRDRLVAAARAGPAAALRPARERDARVSQARARRTGPRRGSRSPRGVSRLAPRASRVPGGQPAAGAARRAAGLLVPSHSWKSPPAHPRSWALTSPQTDARHLFRLRQVYRLKQERIAATALAVSSGADIRR